MNTFLKYTIILAVGALLGVAGMLVVNSFQTTTEEVDTTEEQVADAVRIPKKKKPRKKRNENEISSSTIEDSTVIESRDSLSADSLLILDTLDYNEENEEYFEIVTERLVSKRSITIQVIQPDTVESSELLNLKADSYSKNLIVEFWESPLDLIGYELNRSRLKLFGFNSEEEMEIKRAYDSEKLRVIINSGGNKSELVLEKTPKFKSIILK